MCVFETQGPEVLIFCVIYVLLPFLLVNFRRTGVVMESTTILSVYFFPSSKVILCVLLSPPMLIRESLEVEKVNVAFQFSIGGLLLFQLFMDSGRKFLLLFSSAEVSDVSK